MTLALPSDSSNYNVRGAWDSTGVYRGGGDGAKPDLVAYLGAWWYSTFYTTGVLPVDGNGSGWALDKSGPAPNYNPAVPNAPTNLHTGYVDANTVALFWDVPMIEGEGTVTGYNVYQDGSLLGTSTINAFTVHDLAPGERHTYTVEALDQTGASGNYRYVSQFGVDFNPDPMNNPTIRVASDAADHFSGKTFNPYVDMTLPSTNILTISGQTGLRDLTLAFSQTNYRNIAGTTFDDYGHPTAGSYDINSGAPTLAWGGITNTIQPTGAIVAQVHAIEDQGGTVTISIGGYTGFDPAVIATQYADALVAQGMSQRAAETKAIANLATEFQSLITTYGVHSLDFDVENATTVNNDRANHFRDLAINQIAARNPDLHVTFTVATTPQGLSGVETGGGDVLGVIQQAKKDGVHIDVVNIMAMDYFDGNTAAAKPFIKADGTYNMFKAAVSAANHVEGQLKHLGLAPDTTVCVTPMIGQNDAYGAPGTDGVQEFFSLRDAVRLERWAEGKDWVSGLGEWALPRDRAGVRETHPMSPNELGPEHSGEKQTDWQFARILGKIVDAPAANAAPAHAAPLSAAVFGDDTHQATMPSHSTLGWSDVHMHYVNLV
jgi:hypothetical protein